MHRRRLRSGLGLARFGMRWCRLRSGLGLARPGMHWCVLQSGLGLARPGMHWCMLRSGPDLNQKSDIIVATNALCLLHFQIVALVFKAADDKQWNVNHTQPYPGSNLSAVCTHPGWPKVNKLSCAQSNSAQKFLITSVNDRRVISPLDLSKQTLYFGQMLQMLVSPSSVDTTCGNQLLG